MDKIVARRILKELGLFVLLILAVSFISFLLLDLSPIDPIASFTRSKSIALDNSQKEALIRAWGLDKPLFERYFYRILHLIRGDLGKSNIYGRDVISVIGEGFGASFILMAVSWILQGLFGIVLGIISGANIGNFKDKIIKIPAIVMASTPSYWVGIVLIIIFALKLGLFPASQASPVGVLSQDIKLSDRLWHMFLPSLTLVIVGTSNIILHTRSKVEEILNSDYILYAKARGMKKSTLLFKYGLKNLVIPGLTLLFASFSELFSGTILIENVFNYPGLGNLTVEAGLRGDSPLLLALVLFSAIFVYLGNRICDYLILIINPLARSKK